MNVKPCKNLDYTSDFVGCELKSIDNYTDKDGNPVRYWERKEPYSGAATKVQFCGAGRGRINGIFDCYNPGEMHCYEVDPS